MKVTEISQGSNLLNSDIKWYLFDEKLWISKYNNYAEVEESILRSAGSFNWLYEANDTLLFDKEEGGFETAIIDLSGKITTGPYEKYASMIQAGKKGNLFLAEKRNSNFEFLSPVIYAESTDILFSFPMNLENQEHSILFIVDDFGFVIMDQKLKGWILRKASKHIYIDEENNQEITPHILEKYLNSLKIWEEREDAAELKKMLEERTIRESKFGHALKECIMSHIILFLP